MKRQNITNFLRDVVITCMLLYFSLLIVNILLDNFVRAIFPVDIFGWITLISIVMYIGLSVRNQAKTH